MPATQLTRRQLVKTRKETTKLLECAHQPFDQMTLPIQPLILLPYQLGPLVGRHDGDDLPLDQPVNEGLGGIGAVGNGLIAVQAVHQRLGLGDVVTLAACQRQAQRIAQALGGQMDFAATAAATASQCLVGLAAAFFERPPRMDGRAQPSSNTLRSSIIGSGCARLSLSQPGAV